MIANPGLSVESVDLGKSAGPADTQRMNEGMNDQPLQGCDPS